MPSEEGKLNKRIEAMLQIFDGATPVYFKFTDTGKRVLVPRKLWVMLNDPLIRELKRQLGDKNVCILE